MTAIVRHLQAYNAQHSGGAAAPDYILVTLRDAGGVLAGGLVGGTYLGWLQVHALWVRDDLRGHGYGRSLLREAESEAVRRGCANATLETLSFQALPFYLREGYEVFAELPACAGAHKKYCLRKALPPSDRPTAPST
jgi:GNAT superfamily N-acetyltransferase